MKILVAPLNWGMGHATRCIPLIRQWLAQGHEVVLGGDGDGLVRLSKAFGSLRTLPLAPLHIRYSSHRRQTWAMVKAIPQLVGFSLMDHRLIQGYQTLEQFDWIVSDNRFGLYTSRAHCIYITHQIYIHLPKGWRWLEPLAYRMHREIWKHYDEVWIPDSEEVKGSLSGRLSHPCPKAEGVDIRYIGPLSRFESTYTPDARYHTVVVLSGPEPQRSLLEQQMVARYQHGGESVLLVRGLIGQPMTQIQSGAITLVAWMEDEALASYLSGCQHIVMRSGYTSVMDMKKLDLLSKVEFLPTPGQSEQEYLAQWLSHGTL